MYSEDRSNKNGGASKEDGVLERGLVKFHLRPKESISEGHKKKVLGGDLCYS